MFKSDLFPICFSLKSPYVPMKPSITSRELLAEVGVSIEDIPEIPLCYRPLLITSVITFVSAKKFQKALTSRGVELSSRDVLEWQYATREWLGLPKAGRGKPSDEYRNEVKKWLQDNGNPTLEEIDAGWVPAHRREDYALQLTKFFARCQEIVRRFRVELASLNAAKNDDEIRLLLSRYLNQENIMELLDGKNWIRFDAPPPSSDVHIVGKVGQEIRSGLNAGS